jgi:hypothetical protein
MLPKLDEGTDYQIYARERRQSALKLRQIGPNLTKTKPEQHLLPVLTL